MKPVLLLILIVGVLVGCTSTGQGVKTGDGNGSTNQSPDVLQYQWSQCDRSPDGLDMLKVANTIVELVQARKEYQELPPAQGGYK